MSDGAILRMERLNELASTKKWIDDFEVLTLTEYLDGDPVDNHGDASFTGVWHSAKAFLEYLFMTDHDNEYSGESHNKSGFFVDSTVRLHGNVLEIGAATGWLGITLARNLGGDSSDPNKIHSLVLVDNDYTGAVEWTRKNYAAAQSQGLPHMDLVQVDALNWENAQQLQHIANLQDWNFIIGSDLVYSEDGVHALAKCLATLLRQSQNITQKPLVLYAHTVGRMPDLDLLWEATLRKNGLTWNILAKLPIKVGGETWGGRFASIMDIRIK